MNHGGTMQITPRQKVYATFTKAMQKAKAEQFFDAVDEAVEAAAKELGLSPEAVEEALNEPATA
jgi:hypothetical protein